MTKTSKIYVVTGVSSGVGAATVKRLAQDGAAIIGLDIKEPETPLYRFIKCDLSDPNAIDAALAQIDGPIDGLVNVAGVPGSLPTEVVAKVNFLALRRLTDALLPRLNAFGVVVNVASTAGANWRARADKVKTLLATQSWEAGLDAFLGFGFDSVAAYDFSKEAVILYTMLASSRERHRGVRVVSVSPGAVETPILKTFYETMGEDLLGRLRTQAGGRDARPQEIAGAIAMMLSSDGTWINGTDLIVDGGAEVLMNLESLARPASPLSF
ncbi:coniferyl-alcohol dehydrogenase [Paraburkholderia hospita]|jgi:NAD(P)-dependent dehydrogenase (short-subunit alcohol dehydrogenase family)|uniref:coniferyl-alcohol dehydrogenase n=1 Tax=Paraburkholderia hospita TaxID=169430 RepID=UPI0002719355|nr:coniferyl-alcohol dehydrogenase [Paraburkholderia hospita]EUC20680.1 short-chain dehydrogenase/reductase SDR [Burkholderia sp. BT03]SKC45262.1 NAD(P)-dependent dehydrogenase, short-chain alcohol dehydrogenase family [Paraburkholderia hospita]SKD04354.1 NAD(P)-dependent dehydrogenase, short-chain alcohol dehydrogenase family [Paraburkholderia hospita]